MLELFIDKLDAIHVFLLFLILGLSTLFLLYIKEGRIGKWVDFKKKIDKYPKVYSDHLLLSELREFNKDGVGYFIPNNSIHIFGQLWNSTKTEHAILYQNLERDWNKHDTINIADCKLTSNLLNIIDTKASILPNITIIHCVDQKIILERYYTKYSNVTLKCI
jgi:hypothetical protein